MSYAFGNRDDPGLTTELALVLSAVLGVLTAREPEVAASVTVITAIVLAARAPLHNFVRSVLTDTAVRSASVCRGH